jgi:hypothetical protein
MPRQQVLKTSLDDAALKYTLQWTELQCTSEFFLRHTVHCYRFYLKYVIVPFFSLTLCVMALQQAGREKIVL